MVFSFLLYCGILTAFAATKVFHEQKLKLKLGAGMAPNDLRLSGPILGKLITFAFLGGFMSGALGLGGGAIFNPLLLSLGVLPCVASATGMYMILYSTSGSSIIYLIHKMLNLQFCVWIGFWCSSGSLLGLYILNKIIKRFDRQSPVVFALTFVLGLSCLLVPIFGAIDLKKQVVSMSKGKPEGEFNWMTLLEFHSIC
jgi:uncharacterized membrane protein YfcA